MQSKAKTVSLAVAGILACLVLVIITPVIPLLSSLRSLPDEQVEASDIMMGQIKHLLEKYNDLFDTYPDGTSGEIAKALTGRNPANTNLITHIDRIGESGELLDYWGVPIEFMTEQGAMTVRSAGPNRLFGDDDDICGTFLIAP